MNKEQEKIVDDYIEKYDGVDVVELNLMVQLYLDEKMIEMEGLSFEWLERFSKHFFNITVGIPKNKQYSMYISMFKTNPFQDM